MTNLSVRLRVTAVDDTPGAEPTRLGRLQAAAVNRRFHGRRQRCPPAPPIAIPSTACVRRACQRGCPKGSPGKPHHAATITRCFQDALDRAELPRVRFHDLRHSAATFLLAQGMTLEDVKNQLGHSTIVLTSNTYGHVLEQRKRQVAAAMDVVLGG